MMGNIQPKSSYVYPRKLKNRGSFWFYVFKEQFCRLSRPSTNNIRKSSFLVRKCDAHINHIWAVFENNKKDLPVYRLAGQSIPSTTRIVYNCLPVKSPLASFLHNVSLAISRWLRAIDSCVYFEKRISSLKPSRKFL